MLDLLIAAVWIAGPYVPPSETDDGAFFGDATNDVVEKRFTVRDAEVKRAFWRVCAPGMRDLYVNGERVSSTALPPWTPYAKRILEENFDVTDKIRRGCENVLRVELGNGWYNPLPLRMWYCLNIRDSLAVGTPCVRATLDVEYADETRDSIATDGSWRAAQGNRLRNSIYLGEFVDLRRGFRFDTPVRIVEGPKGAVVSAGDFPKVVVYDHWNAKGVSGGSNGVWLVDMGVNFAGNFRAKLRHVKNGQKIRFRKGERKCPDGSVNVMSAVAGQIKRPENGPLFGVAEECDTFICREADELVIEPRFAFHVFRYVQVEGVSEAPQAEDFEALAWSADVRETSHFECSNEKLNRLHEVCRRTFRSNLQSVQSDCPGREKFGYGGDMACTSDALWSNYDMQGFYRKVVRDIIDESADDGLLTETVPYVGIGDHGVFPPDGRTGRKYAPMGWAVGLPVLLDGLVRYAGDIEIVRDAYPTLTRYIAKVHDRYPEDDIPKCLGDWIPAVESEKADEKMSALAHWYQFVTLTEKCARLLGKNDDAEAYGLLSNRIAEHYRERFVRSGVVCRGRQGDQLFALYHGLLAESDKSLAYARLKADITKRGNSLTTGMFATKYLLEFLGANGDVELAGKIVTHEGYPGWYDMLDSGATTLREHWDDRQCISVHSNCHSMFGSVDEWLLRYVLGISVCADAVGCDKVKITPHAVAGVTSASGWLDTPKGRISVRWMLREGRVDSEVRLPPGVTSVE